MLGEKGGPAMIANGSLDPISQSYNKEGTEFNQYTFSKQKPDEYTHKY